MTKIVLTYEDYLELPDDGKRYELHEGELSVTPAPGMRHQDIVLRLARILADHVDEWDSGANRFDRPGEELFVAWSGPAGAVDGGRVNAGAHVIGVGGLNIDPYVTAHGVGRVRHVYVLTARRRAGVGAQLVTTIVEAAQGRFDLLRLSTSNPAAARLYERLGFARVDLANCTHTLTPTAPAR